jgi:hypothetical protein
MKLKHNIIMLAMASFSKRRLVSFSQRRWFASKIIKSESEFNQAGTNLMGPNNKIIVRLCP